MCWPCNLCGSSLSADRKTFALLSKSMFMYFHYRGMTEVPASFLNQWCVVSDFEDFFIKMPTFFS